MVVKKIRQVKPKIRLFINNGSERSTYMPQEKSLQWLGMPHSGVNLMACYYPKQSFWPQRRLFSRDVPHYRHSVKDQTKKIRLTDANDWTDGYYSFDIKNPRNDNEKFPIKEIKNDKKKSFHAVLVCW